MRYADVTKARFLERPNRFIALVETASGTERVHVKNTGRCRELLLPGAVVYLERGTAPGRKTAFDLIAVEKETDRGTLLINMDAQAPNAVFAEFAASGQFRSDVRAVRREVAWGASRIDFLLDTDAGPRLVEVKGVTLEDDGAARFPDAPTERGVKHLRELQAAVENGTAAAVFFVIQMEGMKTFSPNDDTHPAFGAALREAAARGVDVQAWECAVTPASLNIVRPVPVVL
ncbi:MAG: DNA/RNA nuclease SfsA [Oscillibacter sp.]|nr:DNA/RNA nuclease SfsA [Oscillibacter sp.]